MSANDWSREHYSGDLILDYNDDKHIYLVDGIRVPSVTGILGMEPSQGDGLLWWASNLAKQHVLENFDFDKQYDEISLVALAEGARRAWYDARKQAASIGTLVHAYAERWVLHALGQGDEPKLPRNTIARASCEKFLAWWDEHHIEPIAAEFSCLSQRHWYAGTSDLDCMYDGQRAMVDFKTSKKIKDKFGRQLAAYCKARKEEHGIHYDKRIIALFPRTSGEFETGEFNDFDDDWRKFAVSRIAYRTFVEPGWKTESGVELHELAGYLQKLEAA